MGRRGPKRTDSIHDHRAKNAALQRERTRQGQDIGELPPVKNPARREAAGNSFRVFCETYFGKIFYIPWSKDLLRVIAKIETVTISHDMLAIAMPRGSGKSTLCRCALLWAILYARHKYALLVGAVAPDAAKALTWFKMELNDNRLLVEDFPEICQPIRLLENEARRCVGQRYRGAKTNINWGKDHIVLPSIPGSIAAGSVIDVASLEGQIRGRWVRLPDGRIIRPTLVLTDDPQTAESARSQGPNGQTTYRLQTIVQDIQGLAGPDQQTAILVACTVICPGDLSDQLVDRKEHPDFSGERTKRIYAWPTNKALWEQYRELREQAMRAGEPLAEATEFYRARMCDQGRRLDEPAACAQCPRSASCMDCGAVVDWAERLDDPRNLSALQAAMHAFYKYGPSGFAAEFQNEPLLSDGADARLTAAMVRTRYNGRPRLQVPLECTELVMGVDVQQSSLWWVTLACRSDFTPFVIGYGVWPNQMRSVFNLREVAEGSRSLQAAYPGLGIEGTIQAGLEDFIGNALGTDFEKAGGGLMRLSAILVDSGKWPGVIAAVKHKVGGATMMLSKGVGIKAGNKPMSAYKRKPGERHGDHWYMPNVQGTREFPHVLVDANYWKWRVHGALLAAPGDPGAMTLYGDSPQVHELFAGHIDAEYWTLTSGHGREVHEFVIRPQRPDNHWLDALALAMCAASVRGIVVPNQQEPPRLRTRRRVYVPIEQMIAEARGPHGG